MSSQTQPIIRMIVPQYLRWHHELMVNLSTLWKSESGLTAVFAASGYFFTQKTEQSLMVIPVDEERLRRGILRVIAHPEDWYSLRVALQLAGLLAVDDAIPFILNALTGDWCGDLEEVYAFKSLFMLNYDPKKLSKLLKEHAPSNDLNLFPVLLVRSLVFLGTATAAKQAMKVIHSMSESQRRRIIPYLARLHQTGVDTTSLLDFIIADRTDFFADAKVEWARFVGTREVLERILSCDNANLVKTLLHHCLAAPDAWALIYPLLIDRKDEWLDGESGMSTDTLLPFMAALGRFGQDLITYRSSGNWVKRCGAWLALVMGDEPIDLEKELDDESDSVVQYAIKLAHHFRQTKPLRIDEKNLYRLYGTVSYGLRPITAALVAGSDRDDLLPAVRRDYLRSTAVTTIQPSVYTEDDESILLEIFREELNTWVDFPHTMYFNIPLRTFNGMIESVLNPDRKFGFFLAEMFLSNGRLRDSGTLFVLMALRDDVPMSTTRRAKELLHVVPDSDLKLTKEEFTILCPYVFLDTGDSDYKSRIVDAATSLLRTDPRMALHILRFVSLSQKNNSKLLELIVESDEEPLACDIARINRGELPQYADVSTLGLYGTNSTMEIARLHEVQSSDLSADRKFSELLHCLNIENENREISNEEVYHQMVLEEAQHHLSNEELALVLKKGLKRWSWHVRRSTAAFILHNPRDTYLPFAFDLLQDDDRDVAKVASDACNSLVTKLLPEYELLRFVDSEWNDDEKLSAGIESIRKLVHSSNTYETYMDTQFMVVPFDKEQFVQSNAVPPQVVSRQIAIDLLLHLSIDFVDEATKRVVARVVEGETGEIVNWLLEQGYCTFFSLHRV